MTRSLDQALIQASKPNRVVNPGMRISQEKGATLQPIIAGSGPTYVVDGFQAVNIGATGALSAQQVAVPTPGGSPNRLRLIVTTPQATLATNDIFQIATIVEGFDVADLRFGTSSAKTAVIRFGVNAPAGTYNVSARNGALNRSWLGTFSISPGEAGADVHRHFVVPGDTSGVWETNNGPGINIGVTLAAGSARYGSSGGWVSGNFTATSATSNFMAANGATFDLFDVGIYEGNVLPSFQLPSYKEDLAKCQRYYLKAPLKGAITRDNQGSNTYCGNAVLCPVPMRTSPTVTYTDLAGNASKLSVNGTHNLGIAVGGVGSVGTDGQALTVDAYLSTQAFGWYAAILSASARL